MVLCPSRVGYGMTKDGVLPVHALAKVWYGQGLVHVHVCLS